jgi:superfamily I DNA/RNA helicase
MGVSLGLAEASFTDIFRQRRQALHHSHHPRICTPEHSAAVPSLLPEFGQGYTILSSDAEAYLAKAKELFRDCGIRKIGPEEFEPIQRAPKWPTLASATLPHELQVEWFAWLDKHAYVTLNEIVYHSGRLITGYRHIASAMASHFAWILVNEFQDSSPGQIFILREFTSSVGRRFSASGIQINRSIALRGRRRAFSWNSHNSFPFQRRAGRVKL